MSVTSDRYGDVWLVTVDRPQVRNAVDPSVVAGLVTALDAAENAAARSVVLTGAGSAFIAGGDLKLIRDSPFEQTLSLSRNMAALLDRFASFPAPIIAAVNGPAFGGGAEVVTACDIRVAAPTARVSFRQVAMGLTTGWGAACRLVGILPRGAATRLLLTAEVVTAHEALRMGLFDEIAEPVVDRALELGQEIAAHPPAAIRAMKSVLQQAYAAPLAEARAFEARTFEKMWGADEHRSALDAHFGTRRED